MFNIIDEISRPGLTNNEDLIWHNENCIVVLDGATSLIPGKFDGVWFVNEFINNFARLIPTTGCLCSAVNDALSATHDVFKSEINNEGCNYFPSASATFLYIKDKKLQILNIGDCRTKIFKDGIIHKEIYCDDVEKFDNAVIQRMIEIRQKTSMDICDIVSTDDIKQMLIANREKMNSADGYRILSFNMTPCTSDDIIELDTNGRLTVTVFTDGFSSVEHMLSDESVNLNKTYEILRAQENSDVKLNATPRFKKSDDASCIMAEWI